MAEDVFAKIIDDILKKKDVSISKANANLIDGFDGIEKSIFDTIMKKVKTMKTADGKILFDDSNVNAVMEIEKAMIAAIQGSQYPKNVQGYLRSFDTIKQFNFDVQKDVNGLADDELNALVNPLQKATTDVVLDNLVGAGMNQQFIEPVRRGIYSNVVAGASFSDMEKLLSDLILSNPEKMGLLKKNVTQVSRDALNQFDGLVNQAIAEEFDLNAFRYVGSIIDDSRPQCVKWVKKEVLLKEDLEKEISWANTNGSGMIPGTTSATFPMNRGGYNCRHSAIPFKLTKSQLAELKGQQLEEEETPVVAPEQQEKKTNAQISEIQKDVQKTQVATDKADQNEKLKPELFLSTQSKELNDQFNQVVQYANDLTKIANENSMAICLRTPAQSSFPGAIKFADETGKRVQGWQISTMADDVDGNCANNNSFINIKIKRGQVCEFKRMDMGMKDDRQIDEILAANPTWKRVTYKNGDVYVGRPISGGYAAMFKKQKDGSWKPGGIGQINDGKSPANIAPTITHEAGHAIQNKYDGQYQKWQKLLDDGKFTLADAPSLYGETDINELWCESFSQYVYDHQYMKANNPRLFKLVEDYLEDIGVDKATIKIAPDPAAEAAKKAAEELEKKAKAEAAAAKKAAAEARKKAKEAEAAAKKANVVDRYLKEIEDRQPKPYDPKIANQIERQVLLDAFKKEYPNEWDFYEKNLEGLDKDGVRSFLMSRGFYPKNITQQGTQGEAMGFRGKPILADEKEFEELLKSGKFNEIRRGLTDESGITAKEMIEAFKTGEMFNGQGIYGWGTYFDAGSIPKGGKLFDVALSYAGGNKNNVFRALIPKDAKIVKHENAWDLENYFLDLQEQAKTGYKNPTGKTRADFEKIGIPKEILDRIEKLSIQDWTPPGETGALMTSFGFDGILMETDPGGPDVRKYLVLFNRTKVVVLK